MSCPWYGMIFLDCNKKKQDKARSADVIAHFAIAHFAIAHFAIAKAIETYEFPTVANREMTRNGNILSWAR